LRRTIISIGLVIAAVTSVGALSYFGALEPEAKLGDALEPLASIIVAVTVWWAAGQLTDRKKFLVDRLSRELSFIAERVEEVDALLEQAARSSIDEVGCERVIRALKRAANRADLIAKQVETLRFREEVKHAVARVAGTISDLDVLATSDSLFPNPTHSIKPVKLNACLEASNRIRLAITSVESLLVD
jgi:hypothetical protein